MGEYLISPNLGGSVITSTANGAVVALDVNLAGGTTCSFIEQGYSNFEIIRKDSGSPFINYVFSAVANSFLIHNLGSAPVYFGINGSANPSSSGTGFLPANDGMSFNLQAGSVSIQDRKSTSSPVQVIRLS